MKKVLLVISFSLLAFGGYSQSLVRYSTTNGNSVHNGYKDVNGEVVIPAQFSIASSFSNGVALVAKSNGKRLLIDTLGNNLCSKDYSDLFNIGHDRYKAIVKGGEDKCVDILDEKGQILFSASEYDEFRPYGDNGYSIVVKSNMYGCVDVNGNVIVPCDYSTIKFGEFGTFGYAIVQKNGKYGCYRLGDDLIIPCVYPNEQDALNQYYNSFFSVFAKNTVESELNSWQKKGEFEKIADWKKRVTVETREAKIKELTEDAERKYIDKYSPKDLKIELGQYDAENEVFLVNVDKKELLVPVPIDIAPKFKQEWQSINNDVVCFIENDKISIAEIVFTMPDGQHFKYSNQASLNYEMAQIEYNFEPLALDLQPAVNQQLSQGKQSITTTSKTVGMSDVDTNIPVTDIKSNNTFAVVIANEKYQKEEPVPFAMNDGKVFADYCLKTLGMSENNIHYVANATLNNLKYEINWVQKVIDAYNGDANVIFFYAGHGIPDESNKTSYLLPIDGFASDVTTGYSLNELYEALGSKPCKSVTVFMDACFSGARRDGGMLASARGVAIKAKEGTPVGNMVVFSACQGNETAYPYPDQQHGLFTYFLLKKLKETQGTATYQDLESFITDNVKKMSIVANGKSQTPTIIPSAIIGNDWKNWKLK